MICSCKWKLIYQNHHPMGFKALWIQTYEFWSLSYLDHARSLKIKSNISKKINYEFHDSLLHNSLWPVAPVFWNI